MVMEVTPSPQCVGREFVRQYYTLLNQAPTHVHRFYNNNSSFVHGGLDTFNQEGKPAVGQKQIHQCIQQLNFRDCHAKITQVDSQATLGNGVVVQVTGELSNGGQPMRRFTQTFVLGSQSPKQYYVHNDIFRYQDMVFSDDDTDKDSGRYEEEAEQDHTPPPECPPGLVNNEQPLGGYYMSGNVPTVNGTPHQEEPPTLQAVTPAVQQPNPQSQVIQVQPQQPTPNYGLDILQSQQQHHLAQGLQSGYNADECEPDPEEEEEEEESHEEIQEEVKGDECFNPDLEHHPQDNSTSNEPKTYAATLVKSGGGISNFNTSPNAPAKSPVSPPLVSRLTPQESRNNENNVSNNRTGTRPQRGGPNIRGMGSRPGSDRPPVSRNNMIEENGGRDDGVPYGADGDRRRQGGGSSGGGGNSQIYSDNHQLFMGNLPLTATEDDLRILFSKFGTIVDLRILSKPGGMKGSGIPQTKVPNYGFIIFDSVATVQSVLNARPIFYPDESGSVKLNVEEKKTKPRNSTDGGRIGSGGDGRGARSSSMMRGGGMSHRGGSRGGFMRGGADGVRGAMRPGTGPTFNQRGPR